MDIDTFKNILKPTLETEVCSNCNEVVPNDYGTQTEHDGFICKDCIDSGYGK